jgi:hypothetical protein
MMERGQIVEVGSHEDLIATGGLYSGIHQTLTEMEMAAFIVEDTTTKVSMRGGDGP